VTGVEILSGVMRLAAAGPWDGFEAKRVLMDLYAARAALAQSRAALEATAEHDSLKGAAEHERALFNKFGKALPKTIRAQEEAIMKFEDIALDYTKAAIHHTEAMGHPDITETVEAHLNRRAELFGDVAEAAMRDILNIVAQETMMVKNALPKVLDAIKASEESEIMPEFEDKIPHPTLIPAPPIPMDEVGPLEWEVSETEEVVEEDPQWDSGGEIREEEIQEDAMEVMASEHEEVASPTSSFSMLLEQLAVPMDSFFKKNTDRINDAVKASTEALGDYQDAIKGAGKGRVASEKPNFDHGFVLSA
jgi:hypothetical protein